MQRIKDIIWFFQGGWGYYLIIMMIVFTFMIMGHVKQKKTLSSTGSMENTNIFSSIGKVLGIILIVVTVGIIFMILKALGL